jgi:subtilisin family serine protease
VRSAILLFVLSVALPSGAAAPALLPHGDALARAAALPAEPLQYTPDTRPAAEKLVPRLQRELAARPASEVLPVVVTLVEPKVSRSFAAGQAGYDAGRAAQIAVLEQSFVRDVEAVGFTARHGLVNSPVVIGSIAAGAVAQLAALPTVRAVEYDFPLKATRAQGGPLIGSDLLRAAGGGGNGIGIAILDTGIDGTHAELPWNTKITAWGDYTDTQTGDDVGSDDQGHGTACAGIAAGLDGGMAPAAHLWALKVLDSEGSGPFSNSVSALDDVYTNRDSFGGVRVVSMSLGGADRYDYVCDNDGVSMTQAMSKLIDAGIAIFVASGNEGCSDGVGFPACVSHAIAVGAVYDANVGGWSFGEGTCIPSGCTDNTSQADKITCYSNSGSQLDVLAPADCATTTAMGGGYEDCFNGTSAATPYAAGAAAQILSLRPQTSPAELRAALTSTGPAITDGRNGVTRRRINAMEAYQQLATGGGGGGSSSYFLPAMIRAPGGFGSDWYADVGVLNTGSAAANINFKLYIGGQTLSGTDQVPAGNQYAYANIVGQFGTTGGGLLEVDADSAVVVNARIYSKETVGTKGQFMDGYQSSEGLGTGESAVLANLVEDADYRTNIGFGNTGATAATVTVTLYRWDGVAFGSYSYSIPAKGWAQDNAPFANRYGQTDTAGWAKITVVSGSGVVAYASVVDKHTNDPTTIPMKR